MKHILNMFLLYITIVDTQNNDKYKFEKYFLLQSGIIPHSFMLTNGLFCKDATHLLLVGIGGEMNNWSKLSPHISLTRLKRVRTIQRLYSD